MLNFDDYAVLSFDCYGTLIDWETGIWDALSPILQAHGMEMDADKALEQYGMLESDAERDEYISYKFVLAKVLDGFSQMLDFSPTQEEIDAFCWSVQDWPAFPDSPGALAALNTKYKLAIVSNIDDDLFAYSAQRLQIPFDWVITAEQVQSYKPAPAHFYTLFERTGLPPAQILHVAQSQYHDIATANTLGLKAVWVNRRHAQGGSGATPRGFAMPDLEVPDLESLARQIGLM